MKPCSILILLPYGGLHSAQTGWKACATGILAHYRGQVRGIARKRKISDIIREGRLGGALYDIFLAIGVLQEFPRLWLHN
jgi:hypothetical protein